MNIVNLIGNLTRDPEMRYTTGEKQTAVCRFGIAVNDGYGDRQKTSFINVVVFGKQAENCERYLAKGRKVAITGRIQTGSYEKDGRTIYTTDIIANSVEFLTSGGNGASHTESIDVTEAFAGGSVPEGFVDADIPF